MLHIHSEDLDSNNQYHLKKFVYPKGIMVRSVTIPASFYAVNSSNNTIIFTQGSTYTATIAEGNYTVSEFATALQVAMLALDANAYTVVTDSLTRHYTI